MPIRFCVFALWANVFATVLSADEKARLTEAIERLVRPWVKSGEVKVPIDQVFPLADAGAAHERMESRGHVGKIVLQVE